MNHRLLLTGLLAGCMGLVQAQDTKQVYLVKGSKIVGVYPKSNVDYITFAKPEGATQSVGNITVPKDDYYTVTCPKTAEAGQKVIFTIKVNLATIRPGEVKFGKKDCTYIADDGTTYCYMFTMPEGDTQLSIEVEDDMHDITPKQGDHTTLIMLNSSDYWDDPNYTDLTRPYDNVMGKAVKWLWWPEYGYEGSLKVTSQSGANIDWAYVEDDEDFGKCWLCLMPDEAITIETSSKEKTDYLGKQFVGEYKGYKLEQGSGLVATGTTPTFDLKLNYNTSFYAGNNDEKTFGGCYSFNESNNTFSYLEEYSTDFYGKRTYGVRGTWFSNGDAFVTVNDLNEDKPENEKHYFVSNQNFNYTAAKSDTYGSRYLVELERGDNTAWYYYSSIDKTVQRVNVTFTKGNSITGVSNATVYDLEGNPLFRYSRTSATSDPVFTMKGSEAGTYKPQTGSGSNLVLDGFGSATYGSANGTYTIDNGTVKFTASNGDKKTFVIDTTNKTYTESAGSVWTGKENFVAAVTGRFDSNNNSNGMVAVQLNQDFQGEKQGSVKVIVTLTDDMYSTREIISNTATYTYDAAANQITISGLLVGTANGRSTEKINITFDVNSDKTTLTCNEDKYLRAVSGGDTRYVYAKGLTLTARQN